MGETVLLPVLTIPMRTTSMNALVPYCRLTCRQPITTASAIQSTLARQGQAWLGLTGTRFAAPHQSTHLSPTTGQYTTSRIAHPTPCPTSRPARPLTHPTLIAPKNLIRSSAFDMPRVSQTSAVAVTSGSYYPKPLFVNPLRLSLLFTANRFLPPSRYNHRGSWCAFL